MKRTKAPKMYVTLCYIILTYSVSFRNIAIFYYFEFTFISFISYCHFFLYFLQFFDSFLSHFSSFSLSFHSFSQLERLDRQYVVALESLADQKSGAIRWMARQKVRRIMVIVIMTSLTIMKTIVIIMTIIVTIQDYFRSFSSAFLFLRHNFSFFSPFFHLY